MRRSDREVTDFNEIVEILAKCDVCRIALNGDDGYPYILPLNFGFDVAGRTLTLYFHSATVGKKHDLIKANAYAAFEMDCGHELVSDEGRGYCTMNYESVIGQGRIEYVTNPAEKLSALTLMTDRYHTGHFSFNNAAIDRTSVYKLTAAHLTAKRKASK